MPVQIDRLRYILEHGPIPCWAHLSPEEYQRRIAEIVEEIEAAAARRIQETGIEPLGVEAIRRQNPHQRADPLHPIGRVRIPMVGAT